MILYGLIGYPLGHSFSERYFTEKFRQENIHNCEYRNFPIQSVDELDNIINKHTNLKGLNVTIPYKKKVIPLIHEIETTANEIGAVNTIKIETVSGSKFLKGYNTDVYGFTSSLKGVLNENIRKALILGSGGASVAVRYALESLGVKVLTVSRKSSGENLSYNDLDANLMKEYLLIVNTTPLGTYPKVNDAPDIPFNYIDSSHVLFDLVYNPAETLFMKKGKKQGATVKNGYEMLVNQAEKAWEIWNA